MKKIIFIIICCWLFISCNFGGDWSLDPGEKQFGFNFFVYNERNELNNAKITIGGIKDGKFIGTESYVFDTIKSRNDISDLEYLGGYEKRWDPDLDKVLAISDTAFFQFQLKGEEPVFIYDDREHLEKVYLVHLPIDENTEVSTLNNNPNHINLHIKKDDYSITGYLAYYIEEKDEMW